MKRAGKSERQHMRRFTNKREEWEDTTVWREIEEEESALADEADMEERE
jgi:predicted HNH restriction endonuclease